MCGPSTSWVKAYRPGFLPRGELEVDFFDPDRFFPADFDAVRFGVAFFFPADLDADVPLVLAAISDPTGYGWEYRHLVVRTHRCVERRVVPVQPDARLRGQRRELGAEAGPCFVEHLPDSRAVDRGRTGARGFAE
jgi:hypothetical protein